MSSYHRLPVADKERYARERVREPPMRCPGCETSVQPDDLLKHQAERCPGRPEPHPHGKWITFREALKLGAKRGRLSQWVNRGRVRVDGPVGARKYLMRDVAEQVAAARFRNGNRGSIALTSVTRRVHARAMIEPMNDAARARLRALAEPLGSIEALARKMDISADTLRKAVRGDRLRKGTRIMIETAIAKGQNDGNNA